MKIAALLGVALVAACGGQPGPHVQAHPDGWTQQSHGKGNPVWFNPKAPREQYSTASNPHFSGTLQNLASAITTNTLLSHKGAKFVRSDPFPACPGEAGIQTFRIPGTKGEDVLRVAFTQWNGAALTASYQRPISSPENTDALHAMTRTVCTAVLGTQKFPAAPTARPQPRSTVVPRAKGATIFMGRPPTPTP